MTRVRPESEFPTIADLHAALGQLVGRGLGVLPVQVLVVPDSTMQAVARDAGHEGPKPALMIDLESPQAVAAGRMPACMMSTDRLQRGGDWTRTQ